MTAVNAINVNQITSTLNQGTDNKTTGYGFQDTLNSIISQVNEQLQDADRMTQEFAMGESESLHEVMLATEKSGISLRFLLEIRAKLLEAYQEIMRMTF